MSPNRPHAVLFYLMNPLPNRTTTYGDHLVIDGYGANPDKLSNVGFIFHLLDRLPEYIGMQKIGPPHMASFDDPRIAGVTGVVMIVTSHISIHTYSNKCCFFLDIFSCKAFSPEKIIQFLSTALETTSMNVSFMKRGMAFPTTNLVERRSINAEHEELTLPAFVHGA